MLSTQTDADLLAKREADLKNVDYRLEQFEKHGLKAKLEKQVEFGADTAFVAEVNEVAEGWREGLEDTIAAAEEAMEDLEIPESKTNAAFFHQSTTESSMGLCIKTVDDAKAVLKDVEKAKKELLTEHAALTEVRQANSRKSLPGLSAKSRRRLPIAGVVCH